MGLLASVGVAQVNVYRKLKVATFFTGDEIVEPGNELASGQIYNSNQYTLAGLLQSVGCEVVNYGIVADTLEDTLDVMRKAASDADLVLTSGGVSVGEEDYVRIALEQLGQLNMWRIAMKPGKPVAFGQIGDCLFMGLPGNPVSVFVTFLIFAQPLIRKLQGMSSYLSEWLTARADFDWKGGKRQEYLRVKYVNHNGKPKLELFPHQGSGVLSSVSWASGLTISYIDQDIQKGDMVPYLPFDF
jgi:molybdopterin molybdotransferase